MDYEKLEELGVNFQDVDERFDGNREIFVRILKNFPKSVADNPVMEMLEEGKLEQATENSHSLRGIAGNLSLTALYESYTEINNFLKAGKVTEAKKKLEGICEMQNQLVKYISGN